MPRLTVIAGPNGSGKSSLTASASPVEHDRLLDPDAVARRISPADVRESALAAGREVLTRTRQYLESGTSFAVETTLAGNGPLDTMRSAKSKGFEVVLIYVGLDGPERNIQRVRERVERGGHDVPDEDIRRRWHRSMANLPEALRIADEAVLYDNSGSERRRVLEAREGLIVWIADDAPEWVRELQLRFS